MCSPSRRCIPPHLKGVARVFAQWADTTLFWAAMAYNLQPKGAAHVFAKAPPEAAKAFGEDRKAMSSNMVRLRPGDATSAYRSYLRRIAHMAEEHDFLFGTEPCVADFAAYHALWYTRVQVPVMADILNATPAVARVDGPHGRHRPRRHGQVQLPRMRSRWPGQPSRCRPARTC